MFLFQKNFGGEECAIDVKVKMIYDGKNNDIICQYVTFTKVYEEQVKLFGRTREAVTNTINICKDRGVLKEYLSTREKKIVDMMMTLFDEEQVMRAYVESEKKAAVEKVAMISAIEIYQEMGLPVLETIKKVAGKYKLEENDAEAWVRRYWKIEGETNSFHVKKKRKQFYYWLTTLRTNRRIAKFSAG